MEKEERITSLLQQAGKTLVSVEKLLKFIAGELAKIEKEYKNTSGKG